VVLDEVFGGERVGDVEREIAAAAVGFEEREVVVVADEVAVGLGGADLFQDPLFAGFEDAGRGDPDARIFDFRMGIFDLELAEAGDGVAVVFRVFELAVDRAGAGGPGGVELFEQADDGDQLRRLGGAAVGS
jgi:hypothetical protein